MTTVTPNAVYAAPAEDARARAAHGIGSTVHKVLTLHGDIEEGRVRVALVDEPLGFDATRSAKEEITHDATPPRTGRPRGRRDSRRRARHRG